MRFTQAVCSFSISAEVQQWLFQWLPENISEAEVRFISDICDNVGELWPLTCEHGCSDPAPLWPAVQPIACGCRSTKRGLWQWWPSWWSPAPAHTHWKSGWRKYCALPAMGKKEINKKAKAPLMGHLALLESCSKAERASKRWLETNWLCG